MKNLSFSTHKAIIDENQIILQSLWTITPKDLNRIDTYGYLSFKNNSSTNVCDVLLTFLTPLEKSWMNLQSLK